MRSKIISIKILGLALLLTGCPLMRTLTIKEINSPRIPEDLRKYLSIISLDSNYNFKKIDTVFFIAGRDGATYKANYKLAMDSSVSTLNLLGYLNYEKSNVGYATEQDKLFLNFSIINYCCSPHPEIHCAPTREAAKDTTSKHHCTGWKVNVR